ncbi:MAG: OmpA family protein [Bacteroidetes bacterium]|nr:OmpA family protein [Bacteroidota bacterium]
MKNSAIIISLFCVLFFSVSTFAQFDIDLEKKIEKKVNKEINKAADDAIDETAETIKKGGDDGEADSNKNKVENETPDEEKPVGYDDNETPSLDEKPSPELKVWSKYDFVSGDEIIFEDNLSNEKNGEFPSKWDLKKGNAENAVFGNDNVIAFQINGTEIMPLMTEEKYLPEIFTIEFDIYFYKKYNEAYYLSLKNQKRIDIRQNKVSLGSFNGKPGEGANEIGWHHIAVSFNIRALKVYFDQTRVLNIPNLKKKPTSLIIGALSHGSKKGDPAIIKNIKIAKGGVDLYDKLLTDGKIITTGIRFDINKATIKPESMGVINEIAKLMKDHSDIIFSIEGHTDSDGDAASNQKLSEARANSVKDALVDLGIDASRLETKGYGESNPVNDNSTPEGKASNRRVEFVKI